MKQLRRQKYFIISVLFQRPHMWNKLFYLLHSIMHSVTWHNSRWWLAAVDWFVMAYGSTIVILSCGRRDKFGGGVLPCTVRIYSPGDRVWIDFNGRNKTRHPTGGSFGSEFPAICNHCVVMATWSRMQDREILLAIFAFFLEKLRGFTVKFSKLCSESLRDDTDWRYCV